MRRFGEITETWNPIIGCLHLCVYCVTGDTLVLTADFIWKPIREIKVGEELVGFSEQQKHGYRFLEKAVVTGKRKRIKEVFLLRGENSSIKATEDHLWLVKRGGSGDEGRKLVFRTTSEISRWGYPIKFLAKPVAPPEQTPEYMRGYIAGVFVGDGSLHYYEDKRSFFTRLAMKDLEALIRSVKFLRRLGIKANLRILMHKTETSILKKIESWSREVYHEIASMIQERAPGPDYMKGFLAGIYDAEGSYSNSILRISSYDDELKKRVLRYGKALGFDFVLEERSVRLIGGLSEQLTFFAATYPAVRRKKFKMLGRSLKYAADEYVEVEKDGFEEVYDISTSTRTFIAGGLLSHNCWARRLAARLASMGVQPYAERDFAPTLVPWRLDKRFSRRSFVFVCDMGDLFGDWVPREWILKVLENVSRNRSASFLFLTKNPKRYMEFDFGDNVVLGATVETNRFLQGISKAPQPPERLEAMASLDHEYKALVVEPILDFDLSELVYWIRRVQPIFVVIGYDNYGNRLPEPSLEKTRELVNTISEFTEVRCRTLRKAWYER
ncbi:MAG: hypothetical protein DRN54_01655 [Thaumarchaeota archaeon]|nr:MAG: hypothetical protein DRN54_01655 [Nitrososphaerota archaeon]